MKFEEKEIHLQEKYRSSEKEKMEAPPGMENLKHLQALEESEEEKRKRRCQQGAGQIGQVGAAVAMIVVGAIYHDECTYSKGLASIYDILKVFEN